MILHYDYVGVKYIIYSDILCEYGSNQVSMNAQTFSYGACSLFSQLCIHHSISTSFSPLITSSPCHQLAFPLPTCLSFHHQRLFFHPISSHTFMSFQFGPWPPHTFLSLASSFTRVFSRCHSAVTPAATLLPVTVIIFTFPIFLQCSQMHEFTAYLLCIYELYYFASILFFWTHLYVQTKTYILV